MYISGFKCFYPEVAISFAFLHLIEETLVV